jgi:hypothetical protein
MRAVPTEHFLRSINVVFDIDHPDRVMHYQPTSKSLELLKAVSGLLPARACMVTTSYGSGKSICATVAAHAVMGGPASRPILQTIAERLAPLDKELASYFLEQSRTKKPKGLAVVLEGYCPDLPLALHDAIFRAEKRASLRDGRGRRPEPRNPVEQLTALSEQARSKGFESIALIWDEFGRHLEGLVTSGRAEELAILQQLAEFVSRVGGSRVTLTLLLHQGFFQYAGTLSQAKRYEWKKIEGRFASIQYVDDSLEIYRLLAELVAAERSNPPANVSAQPFLKVAQRALMLGLFRAFKDPSALAGVLEQVHPLDPAVLHMLPRLSTRVAQSERTMFTFLQSVDLKRPVTLSELYDFFIPAMRADTALGGTYRQWLETESALTKTRLREEAHLIKSAALLGLGLSGPARAPRPRRACVRCSRVYG